MVDSEFKISCWHVSDEPVFGTGGPRLMRISLVQISLLRFFKTFQKYLAYAFLGLFISLIRFYTWLICF